MNLPASNRRKRTTLRAGIVLLSLGSLGIASQVVQALPKQTNSLANGVYLYGSSAQPHQIDQNYVVFERHNGKVVGAIYSPRSEFRCFAGNVNGNSLNIKSIETDTQAVEMKAKLANLHQIPTISANEREILSVCKKESVVSPAKF